MEYQKQITIDVHKRSLPKSPLLNSKRNSIFADNLNIMKDNNNNIKKFTKNGTINYSKSKYLSNQTNNILNKIPLQKSGDASYKKKTLIFKKFLQNNIHSLSSKDFSKDNIQTPSKSSKHQKEKIMTSDFINRSKKKSGTRFLEKEENSLKNLLNGIIGEYKRKDMSLDDSYETEGKATPMKENFPFSSKIMKKNPIASPNKRFSIDGVFLNSKLPVQGVQNTLPSKQEFVLNVPPFNPENIVENILLSNKEENKSKIPNFFHAISSKSKPTSSKNSSEMIIKYLDSGKEKLEQKSVNKSYDSKRSKKSVFSKHKKNYSEGSKFGGEGILNLNKFKDNSLVFEEEKIRSSSSSSSMSQIEPKSSRRNLIVLAKPKENLQTPQNVSNSKNSKISKISKNSKNSKISKIKEHSHSVSVSLDKKSNRGKSSYKNPERRDYFRRKMIFDSASEDELDMIADEYKWYILHPESPFKLVWDLVAICIMLYLIIVTPYRFAFFEEDLANGFFYFDLLIDFFFMIDLLLSFFTAFYKNDILVQNLWKIWINFLKTWFLFDLISALPTGLIYFIIDKNLQNNPSETFKSFTKFLTLYRILKWFRILRLIKIKKNEKTYENIMRKIEKFSLTSFIKLLLYFCIMVHLNACLWCYIGKSHEPDNWISRVNMQDKSNFEIFLCSVYFTFATIYTIGYGDVIGVTNAEKVYMIFFMIIGGVVWTLLLTSLSHIFSIKDQKTIELNKKIQILEDLKSQYKISQSTFEKLRKALYHDYKKYTKDRFSFMDSLPGTLRNSMYLSMYEKQISYLQFFQDQSYDFIVSVLPLLRSVRHEKDEHVMNIGDFVEEMFMVCKGILSLHLGAQYKNFEIFEIRESYHIGDILMYINDQSPYEIKVKSRFVDLFIIKRSEFAHLKLTFKEAIGKILKKSHLLYMQIEEKRQAAMDYYHVYKNLDKFKHDYFNQKKLESMSISPMTLKKCIVEKLFQNDLREDVILEESVENTFSQSFADTGGNTPSSFRRGISGNNFGFQINNYNNTNHVQFLNNNNNNLLPSSPQHMSENSIKNDNKTDNKTKKSLFVIKENESFSSSEEDSGMGRVDTVNSAVNLLIQADQGRLDKKQSNESKKSNKNNKNDKSDIHKSQKQNPPLNPVANISNLDKIYLTTEESENKNLLTSLRNRNSNYFTDLNSAERSPMSPGILMNNKRSNNEIFTSKIENNNNKNKIIFINNLNIKYGYDRNDPNGESNSTPSLNKNIKPCSQIGSFKKIPLDYLNDSVTTNVIRPRNTSKSYKNIEVSKKRLSNHNNMEYSQNNHTFQQNDLNARFTEKLNKYVNNKKERQSQSSDNFLELINNRIESQAIMFKNKEIMQEYLIDFLGEKGEEKKFENLINKLKKLRKKIKGAVKSRKKI
jgi:hypothetical protein